MNLFKPTLYCIIFILLKGSVYSQIIALSDSGYLEVEFKGHDFYLFNADSSNMLCLFDIKQGEKLYLLAFDWKYGFREAEIIYTPEERTCQKVKYSYRCVSCPVYIAIKIKDKIPDAVIFKKKNNNEQLMVELTTFRNVTGNLKPFIDNNGNIKWSSLPNELW